MPLSPAFRAELEKESKRCRRRLEAITVLLADDSPVPEELRGVGGFPANIGIREAIRLVLKENPGLKPIQITKALETVGFKSTGKVPPKRVTSTWANALKERLTSQALSRARSPRESRWPESPRRLPARRVGQAQPASALTWPMCGQPLLSPYDYPTSAIGESASNRHRHPPCPAVQPA